MLPSGVIELGVRRALVLSNGLGEVGEVFRSVGEVGLHGGGVAEVECPVVIDERCLALGCGGRESEGEEHQGVSFHPNPCFSFC